MLDQETKRKIDSARDILVGKVPDPKAQVEQITFALIYKFMDDMDKEAEELGGTARFFDGDFQKYTWANLMDKRLSGQERLNLYIEAITHMSKNPQLPQLFRDIFKDAFLPYNEPQTLGLFLKEIDGFTYDHSENLGNAYEYLLSVLGSQGKAGQFRTPRHIIDFIVEVVDPQKNETILDPACGTAGFLISSYKHIIKQNSSGYKKEPAKELIKEGETAQETVVESVQRFSGDMLTPEQRKKLVGNFTGYDISPDMVKLSLVNMYLHEFTGPRILEYDTLTFEEHWDETFDVILANPPFMTPKGGIRPHNRFQIQANRSEVLFVDYIAEHLNIKGRGGVIVPEGIIFQSQNAYKNLRKMLVDNCFLWAVISLPAGVFQPYSGVKTSVLIFDRQRAKKTDEILFVKIENDGFDLGAQRRKIEKNELPEALEVIEFWKTGEKKESKLTEWVTRQKIADSGDYNLTGDRYKAAVDYSKAKWPMVKLGDGSFFEIESGGTPDSKKTEYWNGDISWTTLIDLPQENQFTEIKSTKRQITQLGLKNSSAKLLPKNSVLVSSRATIGRIAIARKPLATNQGFKNIVIKDFSKVNEIFVALMVTRLVDQMVTLASGGTFKEISKTSFSNLEIPLPPLEVQEQIVAELDGYQKVIDGARQVVANWKPTIKIDPVWPMVKLGEVADRITKGTTPTTNGFDFQERGINFIKIESIDSGGYFIKEKFAHINHACNEALRRSQLKEDDVLFSIAGALGRVALVNNSILPANTNQALAIISPKKALYSKYLEQVLRSNLIQNQIYGLKVGVAQSNLSLAQVSNFEIPLPSHEIQKQIVEKIEGEQKAVDECKKLIAIHEQKIKEKIAEAWGL